MNTRRLLLLAALAACNAPDKTDDTDVSSDSDPAVDTDVAQDTDVVDTDITQDTDVVDTDTAQDTDIVDTDLADTDVADTDITPPVVLTQGSSGISWGDGTFAASCRAYRNPPVGYTYSGVTGDGVYVIDTDGAGGHAEFAVVCDMTTDGGGWTQIAQATPVGDSSYSLCSSAAVGALDLSTSNVGAPAKLSDDTINAIWAGGSNELLILGDIGVATTTVSVWGSSCIMNFSASQSFDATTNGAWTLDGNTVDCASGTRTVYQSYAEADTCGFGFQFQGGSYLIWSYDADYTIGCSGSTAGRSWPGSSGNNGCNTSKTWAR
jgi:hypothetical protein